MTDHSTTTCLSTTSPDAANPPTQPITMPSQMVDKSTNCVPVIPVFSDNAQPTLTLVSELTKDDDIVLTMGPQADAESDPCHTIDTSPLYHMVHLTFHAREVTQQIKYY